jgi:hypothetical protein
MWKNFRVVLGVVSLTGLAACAGVPREDYYAYPDDYRLSNDYRGTPDDYRPYSHSDDYRGYSRSDDSTAPRDRRKTTADHAIEVVA